MASLIFFGLIHMVFCFHVTDTLEVVYSKSHVSTRFMDPFFPCPAPPPCTCDYNKIDCSNKSLTSFPEIRYVNKTWTSGWSIDLSHNNIRNIPAEAFKNIIVNSIQISHNQIEDIDIDAFQGSEDSIDSLFVQFNNLHQFPISISNLQRMTMLSIHDNPIASFPTELLGKLSKVQFFDVGSPEMTEWPNGVCSMDVLYSLDVYGLSISIPEDGFKGCEDKVIIMWVESGNFSEFPNAFGSLGKLTNLMINQDLNLSSSSFSRDSFRGMESLNSFYMENTSLTSVPDLRNLPSLTDLSLTDSPISEWDETTVSFPSKISRVTLDKTEITAVPKIISKLKSIISLSFFQTKISKIGSHDVSHLQNLSFIGCDFCPLEGIADDAFIGIRNLTAASFGHTKLTTVPKAFLHVTTLKVLDLSANKIICSCDNLGWMKNWKALNTSFVGGECLNYKGVNLNDFLRHNVTQC